MALWLCSSLWMGTAAFAVVDASSSGSSSGSSGSSTVTDRSLVKLETRSGIRPWVDPDTPEDVRTYVSSRGDTWELIMSDEFGDVNRNFTAGADHLWTSLEMPDGTNDALQLYSHDMTSVVCDDDEEGLCYLQIKSIDEVNNITVWNNYLRPPGYQNSTFYYRSGMLQTWNKFCFQGGMLESEAIRAGIRLGATTANGEDASEVTFGPPLYAAFIVLGIVVFLTFVVFVVMTVRRRRKMMKDAEKTKEFGNMTYVVSGMKNAKVMASFNEMTVATPSDNDDDSPEARRSLTVSGPYHRFR
ncbi:hypothetical protein PC128_g2477 [Phytophthora cactorum]|uniref:Concanavalin A-like lectin/glucanase domain n=1 Tax=Phytophthora cactorum TaxID=29920 RepID=A0A8T1EAE7_9STRA|nr:hypothetical protein PC117_g5944 [Phytophthora cactorum]KAG3181614.1 hypothetical protein C6341_g6333 [Phytophthora cactorum]KAG3203616.1 hypothetical protein PC128_g2477 [Phytophthora cactorum]KAG4047918.1 hypothetical protein PC123_g16741 [Phytophthora cactorum]